MLLNRIWIGMFLIAMLMALGKLLFWQDLHIFQTIINSLFDAAKSGFELSLGLTGALCLWMGFMKSRRRSWCNQKNVENRFSTF